MSYARSCPVPHASIQERPNIASASAFAYSLAGYVAAVGAIGYAIGFIGNWLVPKSIDSGPSGATLPSLLINTGLLSLFVVQHAVMARPGFKRWWTRIVPPAAERSTFVLLASLCLGLLFWQWRPLPRILWRVTDPNVRWVLSSGSLLGWAIVLYASCLINHFDLFGLRQGWLRMLQKPYTPVGFRLISLYRIVRHPLMVGFLIAFWVSPVMTVGHLFFAVMATAYIFVGTRMEERDLISQHGDAYLSYRRRVGGFVPRLVEKVP